RREPPSTSTSCRTGTRERTSTHPSTVSSSAYARIACSTTTTEHAVAEHAARSYARAMTAIDFRAAARDHLWLHFTRMHGYDPPVLFPGHHSYLSDDHGN